MLREVTSQYLISSSLCHDSQESLAISLNSEAVVLTVMVYYSERMPNRTHKGIPPQWQSVEESRLRMETPPSQRRPHGTCSCLQQLNTGTCMQCFCPEKPARFSVQGLCWELVIQAPLCCVISHNHRSS